MDNKRVLLTEEQIADMSNRILKELHKIPLYDYERKKALMSKYIREAQSIIVSNINALVRDGLNCEARSVLSQALIDQIDN